VAGWWFSPGTPVASTKKTDHYDVTEILLKVALNTITSCPGFSSALCLVNDIVEKLLKRTINTK
jgi:hypothetical protein